MSRIPLILVISLFFLWAFVHNLEPILIPHLKKACQLSDVESAFIDSAVYLAYFLMALPAGYIIKKFGYKRGILFGLLLYAIGAILFFPAASIRVYVFFLGALFIMASGCAVLETAANPYVTILGPPQTATTRLNFAQSFNGLGAFIAPILGGNLILSGIEYTETDLGAMAPEQLNVYLQSEADSVKLPYLVIAAVVLAVAALIYFTKMPEASVQSRTGRTSVMKALRHSHLRWGVIAQFFYVGAQVGITSFFIRFAKYTGNTPEKDAAVWLAGAMFGFMVGRFAGTWLTRYIKPNKLLAIYSIVCLALLMVAMTSNSTIAVWAVLTIPFFESIMFPTIFSLSIEGLEEDTELGSSLLVMSIVGGAICPVLMGFISDRSNIQLAYVIPLICFIFVFYFAWRGYRYQPAKLQQV